METCITHEDVVNNSIYQNLVSKYPNVDIEGMFWQRIQLGRKNVEDRLEKLENAYFSICNIPIFAAIGLPLIITFSSGLENCILGIFWYLFVAFLALKMRQYYNPEPRPERMNKLNAILYSISYDMHWGVADTPSISKAANRIRLKYMRASMLLILTDGPVILAWNDMIGLEWLEKIICCASMIIPIYAYLQFTDKSKVN